MTLDTRLARLRSRLTPRQRAALALRAQRAGEVLDPSIREGLPEADRREFNRYMGLFYIANYELDAIVRVVACRLAGYEHDARLADLLVEAASLLDEQLGLTPPKRPVKDWRRKKSVTPPDFLRGLAAQLRSETLDEVVGRWQELRAVEAVLAEIAADFDGEEVLVPEQREQADDAAARLEALARELGFKGAVPEPGDELVQLARGSLERGLAHLRLVEV